MFTGSPGRLIWAEGAKLAWISLPERARRIMEAGVQEQFDIMDKQTIGPE